MALPKLFDVLYKTPIGTFQADNIIANSLKDAEGYCKLMYTNKAYVDGELMEVIPISDEDIRKLGLTFTNEPKPMPPYAISLN